MERPSTAAEDTAMRALLADPTPDRDPGTTALDRILAAAGRRERLRERLRAALTPADLEDLGRAAVDRVETQMKNGAPGWTPGTPPQTAAHLRGHTAMTTIIQRHARDLHAGDIITHDPDHNRPVRWRVTRPAVRTTDGARAVAHYVDLESGGEGICYYRALTTLRVEPAEGAVSPAGELRQAADRLRATASAATPGLAEPLAAWLLAEADHWDAVYVGQPMTGHEHALAVARTILRRAQ